MSEIKPVVSILMGSRSDLPTMENCFNQLKEFGIPFEAHALSAHRTPNEVIKLAEGAKDRGIKVIIAAAGGAAHLGWSYRIQHNTAGNRRSDSNKCTGWNGFLAVHCPDAWRNPGRNSRNRKSRRKECRYSGSTDACVKRRSNG